METKNHNAVVTISDDGKKLACSGQWTLLGVRGLGKQLKRIESKTAEKLVIDCSQIELLHTAGALALFHLRERLKKAKKTVSFINLSEAQQNVINLVENNLQKPPVKKITGRGINLLYIIGRWSVEKYDTAKDFLTFVGQVVVGLWELCLKPRNMPWRATAKIIYETGYQALPIIALMLFLIGIVIAYQLAVQLRTYGANIYVIDATGVAILREFGPLITAVILAGRSSTAFTALIGTMKVNEEIDALAAMGLSPIHRLVIGRIFGVLVALPLLTIWANIFGIFGSMIMVKQQLGIGYAAFLDRLIEQIGVKHYILGMIKTPVFALIIASVGCFQGFQVGFTAEDVGNKTTKAAVQAIFLIIIADALFSIIYSARDL